MAIRQTFANKREGFSSGTELTLFDLTAGERQHLQECQGFLRFLVLADILKDGLRLSMKCNDDRLRVFLQRPDDLWCMCLEIADRFDLFSQFHTSAPNWTRI